MLHLAALSAASSSAETREYALAPKAGDAEGNVASGPRHLVIKRADSALPNSTASLPMSLILLLGQSNVEPGHGFPDDLHNDTIDRVHAVSERAEVCGRQCNQTYIWQPLPALGQWPGQGCEVRCHLLRDLVTPPQSTAGECTKVSRTQWSWYCQMEFGLGKTFNLVGAATSRIIMYTARRAAHMGMSWLPVLSIGLGGAAFGHIHHTRRTTVWARR